VKFHWATSAVPGVEGVFAAVLVCRDCFSLELRPCVHARKKTPSTESRGVSQPVSNGALNAESTGAAQKHAGTQQAGYFMGETVPGASEKSVAGHFSGIRRRGQRSGDRSKVLDLPSARWFSEAAPVDIILRSIAQDFFASFETEFPGWMPT
jgi:hypothetical protein